MENGIIIIKKKTLGGQSWLNGATSLRTHRVWFPVWLAAVTDVGYRARARKASVADCTRNACVYIARKCTLPHERRLRSSDAKRFVGKLDSRTTICRENNGSLRRAKTDDHVGETDMETIMRRREVRAHTEDGGRNDPVQRDVENE